MNCPHCGGTITKKQIAKVLGSSGGKISKRILTPEQAQAMVKARESKKIRKR
jgi:hypothetical protein